MATTEAAFQLRAAADALVNGAIEVPVFESEILDVVRRGSILRQRIDSRPSTGQPHRYFEQLAIATGQFVGTTGIQATVPSGPTRVERPAFIKATSAQTNFNLIDVEVAQQQGLYPNLLGQDINDIGEGIILTDGIAMWTGTDTSLSAPTTIQYMGLLSQLPSGAIVAPGTSIVDLAKAAVAQIVANPSFRVVPTAIYINPVLGDYIDREAKAQNVTLGEVEVVAGVKVKAIQTQAGLLPLIGDALLPALTSTGYGFTAPPAGLKNYPLVILTEKMVERPYISGKTQNPNPRIYQLGLQNTLAGQYLGIMFDCVLAKGATYGHIVLMVQRP